MRIGIDIRPLMSPFRTGVGEYTFELLNAVFEIDKINEYFLFYNSYADVSAHIPKWEQENVHYVVTEWPNKVFNSCVKLFGRPMLDKIIIGNWKLEIGNLHTWFSPNLNFTALSPNVKHILTIHDLSFELYPEFYSPKQRLWHKIINPKKQCQRADLILTPSENTKRDVVECYGVNANKVKVVYPGLSSLDWGEREEKKEKILNKYNLTNNYILFIGTVELRKNLLGLIEAFEQLYNHKYSIFNLHLIITGSEGYGFEKIMARANASPCKDRIHFLGYIPPEEKPALYASADLFIFPSFYEGFGFPVLEAMSAGV